MESLPGAERLYNKSRAEEFGFTLDQFCGILIEVMNRSCRDQRPLSLEDLRLDDLVLARACARGHEKAWNEFLTLYRTKLYSAASAMTREESVAREIADCLYADLFGTRVREDGHRVSKLDCYLGRGSLEGWLRTVLAQEYVNRLRREQKLVSFDEAVSSPVAETSRNLPENEYAQLSRATDGALTELSSEERFLLASYYLDERTLAEIGRMLNVHESTVSRRLEKITAALRKRISARLRRAGIARDAAEEMLDLDVRDLQVDIRSRLAQERES